ncbi:hypothetical protein [Jatrophihabitans endophyticus]|uniref:hypothetical protein n=1 Tax=Jatrophihabitans endophyticus TaxID=1206085 RepID=UPI001160EF63|nr:hypothetical protein [Jatrophihabitans endophyticus]
MTDRVAPRRGWWQPLLVFLIGLALGVLALGTVLVGCAYLVLRPFANASEDHNPSFRYGERVLEQAYGSNDPHTAGLDCGALVDRAGGRPSPFDRDEAVDGCEYEESSLND